MPVTQVVVSGVEPFGNKDGKGPFKILMPASLPSDQPSSAKSSISSAKKRGFLPLNKLQKTSLPQVRIDFVFGVLFVLLVGLSVGSVWGINNRSFYKAVDDLTSQIKREIQLEVRSILNAIFSQKEAIVGMNAGIMQAGLFPPVYQANETLRRIFWPEILLQPDVALQQIGWPDGKTCAYFNYENSDYAYTISDESPTSPNRTIYYVNEDGEPTSIRKIEAYTTIGRPWFDLGVFDFQDEILNIQITGVQGWTEVYFLFFSPILALSRVAGIRNITGDVIAVTNTAINLKYVDNVLYNTLDIFQNGFLFVMDKNYNLAISSKNISTTIITSDGKGQRRSCNNSENAVVTKACEEMIKLAPSVVNISLPLNIEIKVGSEMWIATVSEALVDVDIELYLVLLYPESDIFTQVEAANRTNLISCIVAIIIAALLSVVLTLLITRPLARLRSQIEMITELKFGDQQSIKRQASRLTEINQIQQSFDLMKVALQSFLKYVPPQVVKLIVQGEGEATLGVEMKNVTIFFSDIENFTKTAESMAPRDLVNLLAHYFQMMSDCINDNEGVLAKYIGDGIHAFWNAPVPVSKHPAVACRAVMEMQKKMVTFNEWCVSQQYPTFKHRIGLHTGTTLCGNVGSIQRFEYGVIGDSVNLASRLEGLNKMYGTYVLISGTVHSHVSDLFLTRRVDRVIVSGKTEPTDVYELICAMEEATPEQKLRSAKYEAVFESFCSQQFPLCHSLLKEYEVQWPGDLASEQLRQRLNECLARPTLERADTWTGALKLTRK